MPIGQLSGDNRPLVVIALKLIIAEIMTPSSKFERGYMAGAIACGHYTLGLILVSFADIFLPYNIWTMVGLSVGYWIIKESRDLRRKGNVMDGLRDSAFVALGVFSLNPLIVALAIGAESLNREVRYLAASRESLPPFPI